MLLDTNIILDYLSAGRSRHGDAALLLESLMESPFVNPVALTSSIKDAYYILVRHYRDEQIVRERLQAFCEVVELRDLSASLLFDAFGCDEPDVEDGIVRCCAERMGALALVTRDREAFAGSSVPAVDAREFLSRFADEL